MTPAKRILALLSCTILAACSQTQDNRGALPLAAGPVVASDNFYALLDGRAVEESPTQLQNDFGPAVAITPAPHGAWVARRTSPCHAMIQLLSPSPSVSFVPTGSVSDLAASPDGRWLAYSRAGSTPDTQTEGGDCGPDSIVIRDLRTAAERVWPGAAGGVSSLSWAPDSKRLVFQTAICCVGGTTLYELDTSTAPQSIERIPRLAGVSEITGAAHDPTFAGNQILVLVDNPAGTSQDYRVATTLGATVALLQDAAVSLDADASGQHLLVGLYGSPDSTGNLLWINRGKDPVVLGRGYKDARM